ncbi:MAG: 4Fe-4S dicluster domain-containing protein [Promethearchaeota archaeon]
MSKAKEAKEATETAEAEEAEEIKQIDREIIICDIALCTGCRLCEYACSVANFGVINPRLSKIRVIRIDPTFDLAVSCRRCDNPRCLEACARNAIFQDAETKLILINEEKCDGCGFCMEMCNFGAISMGIDEKISMVCDHCEENKYAEEHDGIPACVDHCPKEALQLVSISKIEVPEVKEFHEMFQKKYDKPTEV